MKYNFVKDSSIYFVLNILIVVLTMILMPFYAMHLSFEDWGVISIFLFFGPMLVGIISMGIPKASYYYYFKKKSESEYKKLQSTNYFSLIMLMLIFGLLVNKYSLSISTFFFKSTISRNVLLLSYVSGCFQALSIYVEDLLTGQGKPKAYSIIVLSRFLIGALISIWLILNTSMTFLARVNGILISNIISFIISIYLLKDFFVFKYSFMSLKKSLKFSYPEIPLSLVGLVIGSLDKILLTNLKGLDALGVFSFGSKFIDLTRQILIAIRKSWNLYFFESINENTLKSKNLIYSNFEKISFFASIPCFIVVLFSEEIILTFGNSTYLPSAYIIPIYAFTYFISLLDFLSSNQITASEKLMKQMPSTLIGGLLIIVLNLVLIPRYGAQGAAFAASIHFLISHIINFYFGQKATPLPIKIGRMLGFFMILVLISSISYLFINLDIAPHIKILFKLLTIATFLALIIKLSNIRLISIKYLISNFKKTSF